jgi:protein-disulfide isomerase-like protein with CxxC motif
LVGRREWHVLTRRRRDAQGEDPRREEGLQGIAEDLGLEHTTLEVRYEDEDCSMEET